MDKLPTYKENLSVDYIIFIITYVSLLFFILFIALAFKDFYPFYALTSDQYVKLIGAPISACICLPFALFRHKQIKKIFSHGIETAAIITHVDDHLKPWFKIKYEFVYNNNIYKQSLTLMYTECTKKIAGSRETVVVVNPVNKRSYIRDVFS